MNLAVILAGGSSKRFGEDKGAHVFLGKALVQYVIDACSPVVDEIAVVVKTTEQLEKYRKLIKRVDVFLRDKERIESPLIGLLTGFEHYRKGKAVVLPCDNPFVSSEAIELMFNFLTSEFSAIIPRWPNGDIEPLFSVYDVSEMLSAVKKAYRFGKLDLRSPIKLLKKVLYVSTEVFKTLDPELLLFTNINEPSDLIRLKKLKRKF